MYCSRARLHCHPSRSLVLADRLGEQASSSPSTSSTLMHLSSDQKNTEVSVPRSTALYRRVIDS